MSDEMMDTLRAKGLLRPERAAEWMDCSRSQIFALIRSGELRSIKVGGLRRIPQEALDEYVARQSA